MATVVFGAAGTLVGGPIGGALGALLGQQIDGAVFAPDPREGPRLKELAVTTSSYGTAIPRVFGTMRVPGTIIWATDIREASETAGGGKGKPSTTTFSYSASFAVAISGRPISAVGRIWADGSLLRGTGGDLKVGGTMRVHHGRGEQQPDPLIAAAVGATCPAFRDCAYVVFEDLQLGEFGSRIPALTFEVHGDHEPIRLADMLDNLAGTVAGENVLGKLGGFTHDSGSYASVLRGLDAVFPLSVDMSADALTIGGKGTPRRPIATLPEAAGTQDEDAGFAAKSGVVRKRVTGGTPMPSALRYYDPARDYQAGVQHSTGRAPSGAPQTIELPANLTADEARMLIGTAADRARQARDRLSWRMAELDPAIVPGRIVTVPGTDGLWHIDSWEWVSGGVELELTRQPSLPDQYELTAADPGAFTPAADTIAPPTVLHAFEMPPLAIPQEADRQIFVAASARQPGWRGAALYTVADGALVPAGHTGLRRARIGHIAMALPPSNAQMLEREAFVEVDLLADDMALDTVTAELMLAGANCAVVGEEVLHYVAAERLSERRWRLRGLLRGRIATEYAALAGAPEGTAFTVIDDRVQSLNLSPGASGVEEIAAIGLADETPALSQVAGAGSWNRPPSPVHPSARRLADGSIRFAWVRRGRGAWGWPGDVEIPLVESVQAYRVGIGPVDAPMAYWDVSTPSFLVAASQWEGLVTTYAGAALWVRQIGTSAQSHALKLATLTMEPT